MPSYVRIKIGGWVLLRVHSCQKWNIYTIFCNYSFWNYVDFGANSWKVNILLTTSYLKFKFKNPKQNQQKTKQKQNKTKNKTKQTKQKQKQKQSKTKQNKKQKKNPMQKWQLCAWWVISYLFFQNVHDIWTNFIKYWQEIN